MSTNPSHPIPAETQEQGTAEDYTTWSPTSLINRITALESQLRLANQSARKLAPPPPPPTQGPRPTKPPKPFNVSRHSTRLIALKFAYLGARYNGFEHHSNNATPRPTVEEVLWRALRKTRLIFPTGCAETADGDGEVEEERVTWEGTEYSKCGRTDRGVSAFGQVVGIRVRSARRKVIAEKEEEGAEGKKGEGQVSDGWGSGSQMLANGTCDGENAIAAENSATTTQGFHPIRDELPYIQLLNRVLPPDIRILAWCPSPPRDFSARFSCRERRYRYFFTNPAYTVHPRSLPGSSGASGDGWLDIAAMRVAARKYEGLHDFRNFCKVDPGKQITNFERRIFHAGIHGVGGSDEGVDARSHQTGGGEATAANPRMYYFEVRGSAFLWHQVRHLVAVLFLVGQGYETPSVVDELLDVAKTPSRPLYEMASDTPLVLWDCIFPDLEKAHEADHAVRAESATSGYEDALEWVYVGDNVGGRDPSKRVLAGVDDGKYGRNGVMDELWALWRTRKMEEVLAGSLLDVVARQGKPSCAPACDDAMAASGKRKTGVSASARVFDGGDKPRPVGKYVPLMQRARTEPPEVVNARYAARKGLSLDRSAASDVDMDE